jgi:hypothetical protein
VATITYKVTVATGTNQYGTGNKYYINGEANVVLYLQEGNTYIFDQSDSTNDTHQIAFSRNPNNSPVAAYTTGVTSTGTPGTTGAKNNIYCCSSKNYRCTFIILLLYCSRRYG